MREIRSDGIAYETWGAGRRSHLIRCSLLHLVEVDPLSYRTRLGYNLRDAQWVRFPNRATHQCVEITGPTRLADED